MCSALKTAPGDRSRDRQTVIPSNRRRLPSNRRRLPSNRRRLPSNRRRLPSNRRRLPSIRRRLPSIRRRDPSSVKRDWTSTSVFFLFFFFFLLFGSAVRGWVAESQPPKACPATHEDVPIGTGSFSCGAVRPHPQAPPQVAMQSPAQPPRLFFRVPRALRRSSRRCRWTTGTPTGGSSGSWSKRSCSTASRPSTPRTLGSEGGTSRPSGSSRGLWTSGRSGVARAFPSQGLLAVGALAESPGEYAHAPPRRALCHGSHARRGDVTPPTSRSRWGLL